MSELDIVQVSDDKDIVAETPDDLEDGEIDDDDEDDDLEITGVTLAPTTTTKNSSPIALISLTDKTQKLKQNNDLKNQIETIDLICDNPSLIAASAPVKSKKPQPVEDDHATSIENAIASALKKKGIEPPMPKLLDSRNGQTVPKDNDILPGQGQSRSSRRRKRKKQRDEKEKEKDRKEKKKKRYESPDTLSGIQQDNDDDLDDYEMLNVRGGSPPPLGHLSMQPVLPYKDEKYDTEDSYSSYDSNDSADNSDVESNNRRRKRGKKDTRKRRGRNDDRNSRQEKRNRRDSPDDKQRQEPRKLELCKFYLMECCAKKDKCSYMHAEFPCKYYYLGMDCPKDDDCKFSHGEPMSEQLRGILLKHLETAPKEILGKFKRISRENAASLMTKRHEELCKEFKVANTWSPFTITTTSSNRKADQQKQQQQQAQQQQTLKPTHNIPSLLDMIIKPPDDDMDLSNGSSTSSAMQTKTEKQRKSRWVDASSNSNMQRGNQSSAEHATSTGPSYLDIKNLTDVLSAEHISKLSQFGITNLEEINQLTVGQLNQIGLTAAEISDIQVNAMKMAKTGDTKLTASNSNKHEEYEETNIQPAITSDENTTKQDVDMRFLPSAAHILNETHKTEDDPLKEDSTSNSNSSNTVVVDYSQYLKDSNLAFDRSDACDDERDDEQLIIDDMNVEHDDITANINTHLLARHDEKKLNKTEDFISKLSKFTTTEKTTLKNPFSNIYNIQGSENAKDPRSKNGDEIKQRNNFTINKEDNSQDNKEEEEPYFSTGDYNTHSNTPPQSGSVTPEASQSPTLNDFVGPITYERTSMYDYDAEEVAKEEEKAALNMKTDKDMRFLQGSGGLSDIDFRSALTLPFQPVTNYTPASEIDGSISSHLPILYKVYEIFVSKPNYMQLRNNVKSDQSSDPRLRRILGLPELFKKQTSTERKVSSNIASPESEGSSPKYYIPPSTSKVHKSETNSSKSQPRTDPRRLAAEAVTKTNISSPPQTAPSNVASQRNYNHELQKIAHSSEWYKNLSSKYKMMASQQLTKVAIELKLFHQDNKPNKIFDVGFILNNANLQQILTNIGIYIDDSGEIQTDATTEQDTNELGNATNMPNFSQPPPQQQMDFLNAPPPNMLGLHMGDNGAMAQQIFRPGLNGVPPMNMPPFGPPNTRPSILGLPPGTPNNPFNPFAGIMPDIAMNPNFNAGRGLLPLPLANFGAFGPGGVITNMQPQQARNFGGVNGGNRNNNRNRRKI